MSKTIGDFGEQNAQYKLERALQAHASRQQGSADEGIDLTLHFQSHVPPKRRIHMAVQIKCGHSYVQDKGNKYRIIRIGEQRFNEWRESNIPVILIWVNSDNGLCYWKIITKKTRLKEIYISKHAVVSPITAIDLSLYLENDTDTTKVITISQLTAPLSLSIKKYAKQYFIKNLLGKTFHNPYIGNVNISWAFWKHLTRKKRYQKQIFKSLSLLSNTGEALLNTAEFIGIRRLWSVERGDFITEGRLLIFDTYGVDSKFLFQRTIRTVIKERIRYKKNWINSSPTEAQISRELFLESIYEKKVQ